MQCIHCQRHFVEDRDYFMHLVTTEHKVNQSKPLDPQEESLLNKYG